MTEHGKFGSSTLSYSVMGDGPLVILSHALGPRVWGWPLERLAAACTVAALESFPQPAADSREVANDLGHASFSLCAWSMAGGGALSYAASQPPELNRLIPVDVAGLGGPLSERKEHFTPPPLPRAATDPAREWARAMWRGWVHREDLDTREYEELSYRWLNARAEGFQRNLEANRRALSKPLLEKLEGINVPTLVLAGRYSSVLGPKAGAEAVARLPDGRLLVFKHSAHALPLEEPERFQVEVAAFLCSSRPHR